MYQTPPTKIRVLANLAVWMMAVVYLILAIYFTIYFSVSIRYSYAMGIGSMIASYVMVLVTIIMGIWMNVSDNSTSNFVTWPSLVMALTFVPELIALFDYNWGRLTVFQIIVLILLAPIFVVEILAGRFLRNRRPGPAKALSLVYTIAMLVPAVICFFIYIQDTAIMFRWLLEVAALILNIPLIISCIDEMNAQIIYARVKRMRNANPNPTPRTMTETGQSPRSSYPTQGSSTPSSSYGDRLASIHTGPSQPQSSYSNPSPRPSYSTPAQPATPPAVTKTYANKIYTYSAEKIEIPAGRGPESYIDRAELFIEDGDFEKAFSYLEGVLDIDPRNGKAYALKLLCELGVKTIEELADLDYPFEDAPSYNKVLRFAEESLKERIADINDEIVARTKR